MWQEAKAKDPNVKVKTLTAGNAHTPAASSRGEPETSSRKGASYFGGLRVKSQRDGVGAGNSSSGVVSSASSSSQKSVTTFPAPKREDSEEDELAGEALRLERDARKLKQKEARTPRDDRELESMARRLSDLAKQLRAAEASKDPFRERDKPASPPARADTIKTADAAARVANEGKRAGRESKNMEGMVGTKQGRPQDEAANGSTEPRKKSDLSASFAHPARKGKPAKNGDDDDDDALTVDSLPDEEAYQSTAASLRKKTFQGLEAGVASFRALGHRLIHHDESAPVSPPKSPPRPDLQGAAPRAKPASMADQGPSLSSFFKKVVTKPPQGSSPVDVSRRHETISPAAPSRAANNPFAEVKDKLAKRNEQLGTLHAESDQMTEGANELLDSVRNLRKRQEKSTFR
jgi:hypothetical protein